MKIGELFMDLGLKGADKSSKDLAGIQKGMEGIRIKTLAVNAAILGMVYGIERSMQTAADMGAKLGKFSKFTGLSTDSLQRWQHIARQSNVASDEVTSSIVGLQDVMGQMALGKSQPEGIHRLAKVGFDSSRKQDTFYVLGKLKEYLQQETNVVEANAVAKSFGLTAEMIQFLRTTLLKLSDVPESDIYKPETIKKLEKINTLWRNFHFNIGLAFGRLTASYGEEFITDLSNATHELLEMTTALVELSNSAGLMILLGGIFNGWAESFKLVAGIINALTGKDEDKNRNKTFAEELLSSDSWLAQASPLANIYKILKGKRDLEKLGAGKDIIISPTVHLLIGNEKLSEKNKLEIKNAFEAIGQKAITQADALKSAQGD